MKTIRPHPAALEDHSSSLLDQPLIDLEGGLDDELGMLGGQLSEVASERPSEQGASSGSGQHTAQNSQGADFSERELLRNRLLKTAPVYKVMHQEVQKVLVQRKDQLQREIHSYHSKKDYYLLSQALAQLRAVVRQLDIAAQAGYELLKEIWLKVVHHFA